MFTPPPEFSKQISAFAPLFSKKVFEHAKILLIGTALAVGRRTVCGALRVMGLKDEKRFHKYHRVLSLAKWSVRKAGCILLFLLLTRFGSNSGPLVFGLDETIERRWGAKIKARGIYRDSARSSKAHFVKCSGLRWISLMFLTPINWAGRVWALPFVTILAPSKRYHQQQGQRHKKLTDWARQIIMQLRRWLPFRDIVISADSSYAAIELLDAVRREVAMITRLRLDACLFDPALPRVPNQVGRPRKKGDEQPKLQQRLTDPATQWQTVIIPDWYGSGPKTMDLATGTALWYHSGKPVVPLRWVLLKDPEGLIEPAALLCTNLKLDAISIVNFFIRRWTIEVTFEEVRAHLGVETQRQWSDLAIARSTPVLMGLFSLITLWADSLQNKGLLSKNTAAWYQKSHPTFSDAIASVRLRLWRQKNFCMSDFGGDIEKIPRQLWQSLTEALARAT